MATRPWVTPAEVREYSDFKSVQSRSDIRLQTDISRAEQFVISYTNNRFEDFTEIPPPVKTAVILLAEGYAYQASLGDMRHKKSETFDDYSYTTSDNTSFTPDKLDLGPLLDDYIIVAPKNGVTMKLRKL